MSLSWKPKARGAVYCAPACGGNCTRAAFDTATQKAAALAKSLGRGWKPVVWENLGWHYGVRKGPVQVYPSGDGYHVLVSDTDNGTGGFGGWDVPTHAGTAREAIKLAVAGVTRYEIRIVEAAERVRRAVEGLKL